MTAAGYRSAAAQVSGQKTRSWDWNSRPASALAQSQESASRGSRVRIADVVVANVSCSAGKSLPNSWQDIDWQCISQLSLGFLDFLHASGRMYDMSAYKRLAKERRFHPQNQGPECLGWDRTARQSVRHEFSCIEKSNFPTTAIRTSDLLLSGAISCDQSDRSFHRFGCGPVNLRKVRTGVCVSATRPLLPDLELNCTSKSMSRPPPDCHWHP